jgi:hypothetical protein
MKLINVLKVHKSDYVVWKLYNMQMSLTVYGEENVFIKSKDKKNCW